MIHSNTVTTSDLLICVVLYEQKLVECETFKSLMQCCKNEEELTIFIYDNSKISQEESIDKTIALFSNFSIIYLHDSSNPGISKAYNTGFAHAEKLNKKWLVFFDQDTTVNVNYFTEALHYVNANAETSLFCPLVKASGKTISPSLFLFGRSFSKKNIKSGKKNLRFFSLINSSMIVSTLAFGMVGGFDEELQLDFSDHYFIKKYKRKHKYFCLVDCINDHSLSSFTENEYEKVYKRYVSYLKASLLFSKKTKNFLPFFWAFMRGVKLSFSYKKISFIKNASLIFKI